MKIIRCVPLAGQGVIARYGDLVAVAGDRTVDPGLLVNALTQVAAAAGDGSDLVLSVARAALGCPGQPAWACAGVTADGGVSVLLHGRVVAAVRLDGGQRNTLQTSGSPLPMTWTFTGTTVTVALVTAEEAVPDPQCWLGRGVVYGGGLVVTLSASVPRSAGAPAPTVMDRPAVTVGPTVVWPETVLARDTPFHEPSDVPIYGQDAPLRTRPGKQGPPPVTSLNAPAPDPDAGWRDGAGYQAGGPVLVDGVLCAQEHFNDPGARYCRQCGVGMDRLPRNFDRRERPPLGVLLFDDGTMFTLDQDYVIGREPRLDGDVIAGRASPLPISDPDGTISRLHLKVSLVGWRVEICDLRSANGSVIYTADGERPLAPLEPTVIKPGMRIGIGDRSMRYLPCEGAFQ